MIDHSLWIISRELHNTIEAGPNQKSEQGNGCVRISLGAYCCKHARSLVMVDMFTCGLYEVSLWLWPLARKLDNFNSICRRRVFVLKTCILPLLIFSMFALTLGVF